MQQFDLAFARLSAEDFVRGLLVSQLKIKKVWVGKDLRFGQGRKGSVDELLRWGTALGFDVAVVEPILVNGNRVSSSAIRELVSSGRVDEVNQCSVATILSLAEWPRDTVVAGSWGFPQPILRCARKFCRRTVFTPRSFI